MVWFSDMVGCILTEAEDASCPVSLHMICDSGPPRHWRQMERLLQSAATPCYPLLSCHPDLAAAAVLLSLHTLTQVQVLGHGLMVME